MATRAEPWIRAPSRADSRPGRAPSLPITVLYREAGCSRPRTVSRTRFYRPEPRLEADRWRSDRTAAGSGRDAGKSRRQSTRPAPLPPCRSTASGRCTWARGHRCHADRRGASSFAVQPRPVRAWLGVGGRPEAPWIPAPVRAAGVDPAAGLVADHRRVAMPADRYPSRSHVHTPSWLTLMFAP